MSSLMWTSVDEAVFYIYYLLSSHTIYTREIIIYWLSLAKERLQNNLLIIFLKLINIFSLHIVNIIYVVLEWVCQI